MGGYRRYLGVLTLATLYFGGVVFGCLFTRSDNVAMVWVSGGVLATWLFTIDRKRWVTPLVACALANELAAGWVGMGWVAGIAFTAANLTEAVAAASLAQHTRRTFWPHATFECVSVFLLGTVLVIPAGGALIAATALHTIAGAPFVTTFGNWMLGHAVGLVVMMPFGFAVVTCLSARASRRRAIDAVPRSHYKVSALIVATMALLVLSVFVQDSRWALAAPLLFAMFAAVWADALVASAMPLLVALIAAPLTIAGYGPIAHGLALATGHWQSGLLYAGSIACCSLPVVVEQSRRRRQIARLSRSAAHFQARSQRADSLIDELRRAAYTDELTALPNRRAFFEELMAQADLNEPACLAMIDIDHFKKVNDLFGHATGDEVLRQFADLARSGFRGDDIVSRIGGEEFAVILRGVTVEQACVVCQRLVDRLASVDIVTQSGPVRVTISSGIAAIGDDGEAALAAADSALYCAKRGGRSRLASVA